MATLTVKKTKFVDIDLNFSLHPISADIGKRVDANAIITAVKHLVFTKEYDRLFHPEIYCQVSELLFENFTPQIKTIIEKTIRQVIENFEPRVQVISVKVDQYPDEHHLEVELVFNIIGTVETIKTNFFLDRTI